MNYKSSASHKKHTTTNQLFELKSFLYPIFLNIFLIILILIPLLAYYNTSYCMEPEAEQLEEAFESVVDRAGLPVVLGITIIVCIFLWIFDL